MNSLLPDPDEESPELKPAADEDLTQYESFITVQPEKRSIAVKGTLLMTILPAVIIHVSEELHRKAVTAVNGRVNEYEGRLSRTNHYQTCVILTRYLAKITERDAELGGRLEGALRQAEGIEKLCKEKAEEMQRRQRYGNIKFVKDILKGV